MSPFSEGNCYIMTEEEVCMQLEMSYYLDAQRKGKGGGGGVSGLIRYQKRGASFEQVFWRAEKNRGM